MFLVDAKRLLEEYGQSGTSEHPMRIHHGFKDQILFTVAPLLENLIPGNLVAKAGDTLHWSALAVQSQEYSIFLVRYDSHFGVMSNLKSEEYTASYYIPKDAAQPDGAIQLAERKRYRMTCHLPKPWGLKIGHWVLRIVDNNTGKTVGHFKFEFAMEVIGHLF